MICPRRSEIGGPFKFPESDEWVDGRCSFCGSMSPEDFMVAAESGEKLGPTDKDYKVYVGERQKFYFQHLTETQRRTFVDLLNAGRLSIGFPGRFYVLPFFVSR